MRLEQETSPSNDPSKRLSAVCEAVAFEAPKAPGWGGALRFAVQSVSSANKVLQTMADLRQSQSIGFVDHVSFRVIEGWTPDVNKFEKSSPLDLWLKQMSEGLSPFGRCGTNVRLWCVARNQVSKTIKIYCNNLQNFSNPVSLRKAGPFNGAKKVEGAHIDSATCDLYEWLVVFPVFTREQVEFIIHATHRKDLERA